MPEKDTRKQSDPIAIVQGPIFSLARLSDLRPPDDPLFDFLADAEPETLDLLFSGLGKEGLGDAICADFDYAKAIPLLRGIGGYAALAWVRVPGRHRINLAKPSDGEPGCGGFLRFCGAWGETLDGALAAVAENAALVSAAGR